MASNSYRFFCDIERFFAQPQVDEGGLDELGSGHHRVGGFEELDQGAGFQQDLWLDLTPTLT